MQAELSLLRVLLYASAQTAVWLYLWYGGSQVMRTRRWQTWWQLGGYSALWLLGWWGMRQERLLDIFTHISDVWHFPPVHSAWTVLYFELEIGWYCSQLLCLLVNRDSRDFYAMLAHHLVTPVEIFFSYDCRYAAIGLVIMFLHDTSDVFLHLAKSLHNARLQRTTDLTFALFAAVFFVTRLCLLPLCPWAYFTGLGEHQSVCGHVLAGTCSLLVYLHCYWFFLIVNMILRFLKVGEVEGDIREKEAQERERRLEEEMKKRQVKPYSHTPANGHHKITKVETKGD